MTSWLGRENFLCSNMASLCVFATWSQLGSFAMSWADAVWRPSGKSKKKAELGWTVLALLGLKSTRSTKRQGLRAVSSRNWMDPPMSTRLEAAGHYWDTPPKLVTMQYWDILGWCCVAPSGSGWNWMIELCYDPIWWSLLQRTVWCRMYNTDDIFHIGRHSEQRTSMVLDNVLLSHWYNPFLRLCGHMMSHVVAVFSSTALFENTRLHSDHGAKTSYIRILKSHEEPRETLLGFLDVSWEHRSKGLL